MMHCDLRVRWKVASDLRFRAAISEPKPPSCCGISGDLAPSTRKSLAIAIVRFGCAKLWTRDSNFWEAFQRQRHVSQRQSITQKGVHTHPLTAREREHWFLQHLGAISWPRISGVNSANTPFCAIHLALSQRGRGQLLVKNVTRQFRNFPVNPTRSIFSKYCRTNGRRTAVQNLMERVLLGFPFFEA